MLSRAQRRAPSAQFTHARLEEFQPTASFDRVFFAFVLHELAAPQRQVALAVARQALKPDGLVAILDWATPSTAGLFTSMWRLLLLRLEPPSVADCLERAFEGELVSQGLSIVERHMLAAGTAQMVIASQEPGNDS
jgi:ubiquinone/menaquinone biosynthesis C-methylase UbiE